MGSLLVVTGPPGAGKSTVSALLARRFDRSVLVEGDRFFEFLAEGAIPPWLDAAHPQNQTVTEAAAVAAGRFAQDYDTIYDGVIGPWFVGGFTRATGLSSIDYAIILPPMQVCLERVRNRTDHGFTDESAAQQMHDEFAAAEIDDRHVIHVGHTDAASIADQIERLTHEGRLRYTIEA